MSGLLEVAGLRKSFGGVHAIADMSLVVEEGTISGLIGPNGAGKSTFIETVTGFARADAGTITFAGREIQRLQPHRISGLGLMRSFQLAHEWAGLTVMENMLAAAVNDGRDGLWRALFTPGALRRAQSADQARARDILDRFGLLPLRNDLAGTLSGGQKRLLEFARLMIAKPRMVMLDEPLAGVNPTMTVRIEEAILGLRDHGITVLLVEHNLAVVGALCSYVTVMALGTPVAAGTMADVLADPIVIDAYLGTSQVPIGASA